MLTPEERQDAIKGVPEGLDLLNELIDERRANPGDDFLSTLILAEDEGSKLSNLEMCALVGAVLGAGSDTAEFIQQILNCPALGNPCSCCNFTVCLLLSKFYNLFSALKRNHNNAH